MHPITATVCVVFLILIIVRWGRIFIQMHRQTKTKDDKTKTKDDVKNAEMVETKNPKKLLTKDDHTEIEVGGKKVTIILHTKNEHPTSTNDGGITFFNALRQVEEFNREHGTLARLIGHRTAEILLSSGKFNHGLEMYSPFWTGTIIAYETRRANRLGKTISSHHQPKDKPQLYTAHLPTEEFCGDQAGCALTIENISIDDFTFDDDQRTITIKNNGRAIKTKGLPQHPEQLHQDEHTGVPSRNASTGRKLWLLRKDRPEIFGGCSEGEIVNPFFDNYVGPIARCAPIGEYSRADEAFSAHTDFFDMCGVLMEVDEEDLCKIT